MPLSRLLTIFVGITVILSLVLWLVSSLYRLYLQVAWTSPLLGQLLVLLIILLLGVLIAAFAYYVGLFPSVMQTKKRRRAAPKIPQRKIEAASETLQALKQQVDLIQDEVAKQALISKSREIESSLARGDLQVVVFGTGSAGKTSVVNALLGRMAGQVGAPMGTTEVGETYILKLRGLDREILITDTPGILEAGEGGKEREKRARQLATEADLLVFVVDNDLSRSEYEPLRGLVEIGKRSLIVFNKTDRYPEAERELILARLRERVRGFVSMMDVVAVVANPQPVKLDGGGVFQMEPDIMPLIRRMAAVLRAEGEDLVADNILLQSMRLGEEARRLLDGQRRRQAEKVVERFQWIGAGAIALTPLPGLDLLATCAVNAQMVIEIGNIYGCEINKERGRELALSLAKTLAGLGIVKGAVNLIATALQTNPGTLAVGKAVQGISAAYITRIAGKSFIEYFRHDQDWGDGGIAEVVQRQFQLNRKEEFFKGFVKDAINRVVEPLKLDIPISPTEAPQEMEIIPQQLDDIYDDWEKPSYRQSQDDW
ncbi:MAG TPA: DUF697 domain-containing protein [Oscillatoriaceae cyanobacterium M33_DOE_052]|uniref:DUF697 domain-containing protein n=1 Tax=Planktothricoides sp. SpSt-374 TaxID=2282167 RepID=A0A7C3ZMR8_9CYAN|nr:DUF697 domain-containing protein [Oscillatoriaceae cyanobacterium M33_DOE_052]